jgi:integrative and conjugative element protein (TIGR02256 family)
VKRKVAPTGRAAIYRRRHRGHFQIGTSALGVLKAFAQTGPSVREAGGVLLGRHILDSRDIVVDQVTTPMRGDRRSRQGFFRAAHHHQQAIDRAWIQSGGTCTYLGEWHTHPEAYPNPSEIDRLDWQRKLREDRYSQPIFFVIVGTVEIRVWEGGRGLCSRPFRLLSGDESYG